MRQIIFPKSVQHFDRLSESGPLCLCGLAPALHFIANPFRWNHNGNSVKYGNVEMRVL